MIDNYSNPTLIAQVYDYQHEAIRAFENYALHLWQLFDKVKPTTVELYVNKRDLIIEYGCTRISFYTKEYWITQSACRYTHVVLNCQLDRKLMGLKMVRERNYLGGN